MSVNGALTLGEVRARAATALAPASPNDPTVFLDVVDAVEPPAILLVWDDPWLEPQSFGPCLFKANLAILCIAARLEPGPGVQTLEEMVAYTVERLRADAYRWPQASSRAPRVFRIGNLEYLAARVVYRLDVTTEGGP